MGCVTGMLYGNNDCAAHAAAQAQWLAQPLTGAFPEAGRTDN